MITKEKLKEWQSMCDAAHDGPWRYVSDKNHWVDNTAAWGICNCHSGPRAEQDARLIAASRTAMPDLIAEARRLRAANEKLRAIVKDYEYPSKSISGDYYCPECDSIEGTGHMDFCRIGQALAEKEES